MNGGGSEAPPPPVDGGEFLLELLKKPAQSHKSLHFHQSQSSGQPPQPTQTLSQDPAVVASFGATVPIPFPQQVFPSNGVTPSHWTHQQHLHQSSPPFAPHAYFFQNPSPNPNPNLNQLFPTASPPGINQGNFQQNNAQFNRNLSWDDARNSGLFGSNSSASSLKQCDGKDLVFGSVRASEGPFNGSYRKNFLPSLEDKKNVNFSRSQVDKRYMDISSMREHRREVSLEDIWRVNDFGVNNVHRGSTVQNTITTSSIMKGHGQEGSDISRRGTGQVARQEHNISNHRAVVPPPGFTREQINGGNREYNNGKESFEYVVESRYQSGKGEMGRSMDGGRGLVHQFDQPGPPAGSKLLSVSASDIEHSMIASHAEDSGKCKEFNSGTRGRMKGNVHGDTDLDDLEEQLMDLVRLEDESDDKSDQKKQQGLRDKEYRSDKRGKWLMAQRMRHLRSQVACRGDIDVWNTPFLAIYESLIPAEEEKSKQKQLLTLLERVVCKEWPKARLFLYGSCANSFGFPKSDLDVCLTIDDVEINKSDVLLRLADMLQLENLQKVQALTRARVPIVKLMDPTTGISCDICVNNVLAVVNTKLLRDYAQIDTRLRQLAFIVKHWAKSRGVNETYQGTLSSYAYVLMCIHYLQHRRPAILPCLQGMKPTYSVTIDDVDCSYFDQVDEIIGFGSQNREGIAQLVWGFFNYWAYCHDYANDVISVRTGTLLSKRAKDWTRRIGNDRHLICIEDPFEISHDLGRVVDKRSIRVLREEFERAAEIIQYDQNPCVKLFEPYIPS